MASRWPGLLPLSFLLGCGVAEVGGLESNGPWAPIFPEDGGVLVVDASPPPRDAGVRDRGVRDATFPDAEAPDAEPPPPPPEDILEALRTIPRLRITEIEPAPIPGTRAFQLRFTQPENHDEARGPVFRQRMVLIHRSMDAPTVLHQTGYGMFGDQNQFAGWDLEPTVALEANQLTVEHRFFGESIVSATPPRWEYLTVEQSARDAHAIVEAFRAIYQGPWIGTGISKGGMTTIFHHHYFPNDLAGIVPYVAPISFGPADPRYPTFLAQVGPADGGCRARVQDLSLETVERRAELAEYFADTDPRASGYTLSELEAMIAVNAEGILWFFWQYYAGVDACQQLPPRGGPVEILAAFSLFDPNAYTTQQLYDPELTPYYYQVARELGYPSLDFNQHLAAALSEVDFSELPPVPADPRPWGPEPSFDPATMVEVDQRLRTTADHLRGIYGEWDPWTGGKFTVAPGRDVRLHVAAAQNHGASIWQLPTQEQDEIFQTLFRWVGRSNLVAPDYAGLRQRLAQSPGHRRAVELVLLQERRALLGRTHHSAVGTP